MKAPGSPQWRPTTSTTPTSGSGQITNRHWSIRATATLLPRARDPSAWQAATYAAIRGTGNKNPILLEPGGDVVGTFRGGAGVPMMAFQDPTVVATMTNVIWDPHIYGYMDNYATDAATNNALVTQVVAAVQAVQSADGVVPAIIGEYRPEGANGTQLVTAVINAGASGTTGSGAWVWDQDGVVGGPSGDPTGLVDFGLLSGGQLTTYGQMVALHINTNVVPLTNCQLTPQAQQQINTITAQVTAPTTGTPDASTPATTAPDTSAAATDPSTATLIQQGDAAVAQGNAIAAAAQHRCNSRWRSEGPDRSSRRRTGGSAGDLARAASMAFIWVHGFWQIYPWPDKLWMWAGSRSRRHRTRSSTSGSSSPGSSRRFRCWRPASWWSS